MQIEGPIAIAVTEDEATLRRQLHIRFSGEFQARDAAGRGRSFQSYVDTLRIQSAAAEAGSREQQGILTVLQVASELVPHIVADEIDLSEEIVVAVQPGNPLEGMSGVAAH